MSIKTMPVSDVRKTLNALMSDLEQPIFITQRGRVKAVLVSQDEYDEMLDYMQDLEDSLDPEIRKAFEDARAGRTEDFIPIEEVMRRYGLQGTVEPAGGEGTREIAGGDKAAGS